MQFSARTAFASERSLWRGRTLCRVVASAWAVAGTSLVAQDYRGALPSPHAIAVTVSDESVGEADDRQVAFAAFGEEDSPLAPVTRPTADSLGGDSTSTPREASGGGVG